MKTDEKHNLDDFSIIISRCVVLDAIAFAIYEHFAKFAPPEDKFIWEELAADEKNHVKFWKERAELLKNGLLPEIVENREALAEKLTESIAKIRSISNIESYNRKNCLQAALEIEAHLLMPEFIGMFSFYSENEKQFAEEYTKHLEKLIKAIKHFGEFKELEFLTQNIIPLFKKNLELTVKAVEDPLTQLLNRRGFFQRAMPKLELAVREKKGIVLLTLDLDNFKKINDSFGHHEGDRIIRETAKTIKNAVRQYDIASRFGGDEFVILALCNDENEALRIAERIRNKISFNVKMADGTPLQTSVGAKFAKPQSSSISAINQMICEADKSLYEAKNSGKNKTKMS